MSALITVDLRDATPPYEQIRAQVASLIAVGQLTDGARLPTVRALASDLGVATGTVARAYKELETAGLIESRRRLGTVVTHKSSSATQTAASPLEAMLDELINQSRASGVADETLLSLVRGRMGTLKPPVPEPPSTKPTNTPRSSE
ncbi:GntR family transcriptional regulator [Arthrobacter sp. MYb227]|uniref:GntR family transcriptional regulator n=1 Tax=Arthrobacter sp. MYb227 TaxID=1848601 RepID=UPI000CFC46BC|nr:GntR family transcriptional regulator [Arthrobacter sp. MYb227]PQZ96145.1 GntR family transcriptional regulator [Arthrobacter sp. MYb227]